MSSNQYIHDGIDPCDAEQDCPLCQVVIFRKIGEATGHGHSHMQSAIANYVHVLRATGLSEADIAVAIAESLT